MIENTAHQNKPLIKDTRTQRDLSLLNEIVGRTDYLVHDSSGMFTVWIEKTAAGTFIMQSFAIPGSSGIDYFIPKDSETPLLVLIDSREDRRLATSKLPIVSNFYGMPVHEIGKANVEEVSQLLRSCHEHGTKTRG